MRIGVPHRTNEARERRHGPARRAAARRAKRRPVEPPPRPQPAPTSELARARMGGGPIDRASYGCGCGYQFSADVSTSVCCPHCGATQAW
jgi:hypothetical protein